MNIIDYGTRQKIGGSHASISFVKQFPVLTHEQITSSGYERDIVERVARLCWFNHDLDGWLEELREECSEEYSLPGEPVIVNGNDKCTDFGNRECSDFGNSNAPISVTTIHNFR